jgi:GT2 family glycosyltransferase
LLACDVVRIGYAYGACLLMPVAVVREVGLLDERFFLQLEEEDYFRRAMARGIHSYCARRARILHKESASFGARITADKTYYQVRNTLLLIEKHAGSPAQALRLLRQIAWTLWHQARSVEPAVTGWTQLLRWSLSAHELARAARHGVRDYACRRFGQRRV